MCEMLSAVVTKGRGKSQDRKERKEMYIQCDVELRVHCLWLLADADHFSLRRCCSKPLALTSALDTTGLAMQKAPPGRQFLVRGPACIPIPWPSAPDAML